MGDPEDPSATHRATYDDVAARFAVVNAQMPPAVLDSARQLLEIVGAPARILELGCGHGRDAAWLEAHGVDVVAADLSAGMLAETRLRVTGPVVQLDMRALAFRSAVFDGVWSNAAMLHLPKAVVPGALAGVRRILRPGGVFFVSIQVGAGETWEAVSYGQLVLVVPDAESLSLKHLCQRAHECLFVIRGVTDEEVGVNPCDWTDG